ncbi:MAG: hypothetical protein ACSW8J_00515 [bacterium]
MLQSLHLRALPGAPVNPADDAAATLALEQLARKEWVIVANGTIYVDRLINYLLQNAASARVGITITDNRRTAALWKSEKLFILGDFPMEGECALTPLQDAEAAQEALTDAVCRMVRPLWAVNVFIPHRRFSVAANEFIAPRDIARRAMTLMNSDDL